MKKIRFPSDDDEDKAIMATVITAIGSGLFIGSLPFFISSNASKRKAHVTVSSQPTGSGIPPDMSKTIPGMSLTMQIGK